MKAAHRSALSASGKTSVKSEKPHEVCALVIYRWNDWVILKLWVKFLWPLADTATLAAALTLTFICTLMAHGAVQAVCFEAFPFFLFFCFWLFSSSSSFLQSSLSPGHNPECGPDKVTFVHTASDSFSPGHWWGLHRPDALFSHFCWQHNLLQGGEFHANSKAKPDAFHLRVCVGVWVCMCVSLCELSNWKLTLAITNWTLIKCGPRYTSERDGSARRTGPTAISKVQQKRQFNWHFIEPLTALLFEKLPETGNFFFTDFETSDPTVSVSISQTVFGFAFVSLNLITLSASFSPVSQAWWGEPNLTYW